ncbi:hypothetical protein [Stenotrophomonas maltophilia]|uniref:Uncharacterized protein n=1 Tax=Stenotrophomonas maltophilia TaxID=40324 RepID=A0A2W6HXM9_STEMA|nr:hypothetical protein [Stenotrophomonas maltophilia]PZS87674.1 hypothetical protein A7X83_01650 [Stenotrophomonas maltophilia]
MSKILTGEEIAKHLGIFARTMYDSCDWTVEHNAAMSIVVGKIIESLIRSNETDIRKFEEVMLFCFYKFFGMKPRGFDGEVQLNFWVVACKTGDDDLAFRLLMDGFNPKVRWPDYHSARHYAKANRLNLPKTWSYFCQEDLTKKAAKVRKRSWASGTYTERAM